MSNQLQIVVKPTDPPSNVTSKKNSSRKQSSTMQAAFPQIVAHSRNQPNNQASTNLPSLVIKNMKSPKSNKQPGQSITTPAEKSPTFIHVSFDHAEGYSTKQANERGDTNNSSRLMSSIISPLMPAMQGSMVAPPTEMAENPPPPKQETNRTTAMVSGHTSYLNSQPQSPPQHKKSRTKQSKGNSPTESAVSIPPTQFNFPEKHELGLQQQAQQQQSPSRIVLNVNSNIKASGVQRFRQMRPSGLQKSHFKSPMLVKRQPSNIDEYGHHDFSPAIAEVDSESKNDESRKQLTTLGFGTNVQSRDNIHTTDTLKGINLDIINTIGFQHRQLGFISPHQANQQSISRLRQLVQKSTGKKSTISIDNFSTLNNRKDSANHLTTLMSERPNEKGVGPCDSPDKFSNNTFGRQLYIQSVMGSNANQTSHASLMKVEAGAQTQQFMNQDFLTKLSQLFPPSEAPLFLINNQDIGPNFNSSPNSFSPMKGLKGSHYDPIAFRQRQLRLQKEAELKERIARNLVEPSSNLMEDSLVSINQYKLQQKMLSQKNSSTASRGSPELSGFRNPGKKSNLELSRQVKIMRSNEVITDGTSPRNRSPVEEDIIDLCQVSKMQLASQPKKKSMKIANQAKTMRQTGDSKIKIVNNTDNSDLAFSFQMMQDFQSNNKKTQPAEKDPVSDSVEGSYMSKKLRQVLLQKNYSNSSQWKLNQDSIPSADNKGGTNLNDIFPIQASQQEIVEDQSTPYKTLGTDKLAMGTQTILPTEQTASQAKGVKNLDIPMLTRSISSAPLSQDGEAEESDDEVEQMSLSRSIGPSKSFSKDGDIRKSGKTGNRSAMKKKEKKKPSSRAKFFNQSHSSNFQSKNGELSAQKQTPEKSQSISKRDEKSANRTPRTTSKSGILDSTERRQHSLVTEPDRFKTKNYAKQKKKACRRSGSKEELLENSTKYVLDLSKSADDESLTVEEKKKVMNKQFQKQKMIYIHRPFGVRNFSITPKNQELLQPLVSPGRSNLQQSALLDRTFGVPKRSAMVVSNPKNHIVAMQKAASKIKFPMLSTSSSKQQANHESHTSFLKPSARNGLLSFLVEGTEKMPDVRPTPRILSHKEEDEEQNGDSSNSPDLFQNTSISRERKRFKKDQQHNHKLKVELNKQLNEINFSYDQYPSRRISTIEPQKIQTMVPAGPLSPVIPEHHQEDVGGVSIQDHLQQQGKPSHITTPQNRQYTKISSNLGFRRTQNNFGQYNSRQSYGLQQNVESLENALQKEQIKAKHYNRIPSPWSNTGSILRDSIVPDTASRGYDPKEVITQVQIMKKRELSKEAKRSFMQNAASLNTTAKQEFNSFLEDLTSGGPETRDEGTGFIQKKDQQVQYSHMTPRKERKGHRQLNNTCITLPFFEISSFVEDLIEDPKKNYKAFQPGSQHESQMLQVQQQQPIYYKSRSKRQFDAPKRKKSRYKEQTQQQPESGRSTKQGSSPHLAPPLPPQMQEQLQQLIGRSPLTLPLSVLPQSILKTSSKGRNQSLYDTSRQKESLKKSLARMMNESSSSNIYDETLATQILNNVDIQSQMRSIKELSKSHMDSFNSRNSLSNQHPPTDFTYERFEKTFEAENERNVPMDNSIQLSKVTVPSKRRCSKPTCTSRFMGQTKSTAVTSLQTDERNKNLIISNLSSFYVVGSQAPAGGAGLQQ